MAKIVCSTSAFTAWNSLCNVNKRVVSWVSDGEKNNVIDCNIKSLGLNIKKKLPAKRKKQLFVECRLILRTDVMSTFRICRFCCFAFSDT